ncbi:hydrolase [Verrucomicrobia bacterium LW23]|nr:hydrolase [Verrucomicrobia bacterium LW23]
MWFVWFVVKNPPSLVSPRTLISFDKPFFVWQHGLVTVQDLLRQTLMDGATAAVVVLCQVSRIRENSTRTGKPYLELEIADSTGRERFRLWEDSQAYDFAEDLQDGDCVRLDGVFSRNHFGLNVERLHIRMLEGTEVTELFAGPPERRAALQRDWDFVNAQAAALADPRLRMLCQTFLTQYQEKFRRAAAARSVHHARRGGLLEHTAQMMRAAAALEGAYPTVNWDLVKTGVLFHDSGKMWELDYTAQGFTCPITPMGEMLGHITLGIELVNRLWRQVENDPVFGPGRKPSRESVREHLMHMIGSHHGTREFGATVTPRTPEAWMLHYIDNIDAKFEMMSQTYKEKPLVAPQVYDFRRPLEERAIEPLAKWSESHAPATVAAVAASPASEAPLTTEPEPAPTPAQAAPAHAAKGARNAKTTSRPTSPTSPSSDAAAAATSATPNGKAPTPSFKDLLLEHAWVDKDADEDDEDER